MNNTNSPKFVLLLTIILCGFNLAAQNTKQAVILYNTDPVLAEITSAGEVNKIIAKEPNFLSGFRLVKYDLNLSETVVVAEIPAPAPAEERTGYAVVSSIYHEVYFDPGFAVLRKDGIAQLDQILKVLESNPERSVLISDFSEYDSDQLHQNRVSSIKSYLKLKGISSQRIRTNRLMGVYNENSVRINFVE
ncbi:MAG: hypothetical protein IPM42_03225 [Saprospiraceae bacterium]|nr:hypothetical protein [Saprospiraceae bacterium]